MSKHFKGRDALLLQEYFDLKVKLSELRTKREYFERFFKDTNDVDDEIQDVKKNIVETICMFDTSQLTQIIYMGLNIDYNELVLEGVIR